MPLFAAEKLRRFSLCSDQSALRGFFTSFGRVLSQCERVALLTGIHVPLGMTLAWLFWAMGGHEDLIAKLIWKTL
jgi:type IV secretory pathway TrbL component